MTYTAMVSWSTQFSPRYTEQTRTLRGLTGKDIHDVREQLMKQYKDHPFFTINCLWYDWEPKCSH